MSGSKVLASLHLNYLRVTLAPSPSSFVLISSASALDAPSLTTLGAPSTTSLASFKPNPVTSRTTLITLTLLGPTSVSSTSNSSFSSAAPAASPAAATTTPAAADTPNSSSQAFTNSFHSNTDNSLIASINSAVVNFAILNLPPFFRFLILEYRITGHISYFLPHIILLLRHPAVQQSG